MPQIVELPDGIEVEFPDDMSAEQIDFEVNRSFPQFNAKPLDRVPEPGGGLPQLTGGVQSSMPQAFPATESRAQANIAAATPELSVSEAEQILTTPAVSLPRVGAEGTLTRGLSEVGAGLVEQAALTPASPILALAGAVPGVRAAAGAVFTYAGAKGAIQKGKEYYETGNRQALGEAIGTGALSALGAVGVGADIIQSRPGVFVRETLSENLRPSAAPAAAQAAQATVSVLTPQVTPETPVYTGPRRLPAPGETLRESVLINAQGMKRTLEPPILLEGSELGPRTAGYRIKLPIESEAAKATRQRWSKPIDIEAQVEGVEALRGIIDIADEVKTPGKPYEPPSVNVDLRQLEKVMQKNTVSKVESWADQVIRDRLGGASANPFLDPELLAAASVKGAILFKRGVVNFAEWSNEMRKQFGVGIDDRLPMIFEQSKGYWEQKKSTPTAPKQDDAVATAVEAPKEEAAPTEALHQLGFMPGSPKISAQEALKTGVKPGGSGMIWLRPMESQQMFTGLPEAKNMVTVQLPEGLKLLEASNKADLAKKLGVDWFEIDNTDKPNTAKLIAAKLRELGYDGFIRRDFPEMAIISDKPLPVKDTTGGAAPSPFSPEALATPASKTVGLVPPASGTPAGVVFNIKSALQKWFRTRGHLPEEVFDLAQELEGARSSANLQVKYANRDLMNALAETYGISKLEMAGGGSKRIPPAAIQLMDDYLHGRVANGAQIPPNIRGVLDTMRAEIEGGSQKIIATLQAQRGKFPQGSAKYQQMTELIDTIRGNMDVYVHRSYKFFDSDSSAPQWYADLPDPIKQAAESYVANNSPVPLTQAEAQSHILDWLSDLKQTDSFGSSKLGSKDNSIFMRRKMVPPELRAVLGEYRNPAINYAKSVTKMADWVAKQKFLDDVKARGMGTFLFEEGMNPPGFNTQIAADSSRTMSPLNGLRTSEEIAAAFKEFDAHPAPEGIWRGYLMVNAWTKAASTVLSAMTQVRNLSSRPLMAGMAGHWRLGELGRSIQSVATDFAGTDKTWQAYMRRASELGVVGDTARSGELRAIIKDAALQDVAPADLYSWSLWRFIKKFGYDLPADVYRISDELGNLYGFENEKAIQAKINPHLTPAEIETRAARIVRDIYPTYSLTPSAVKGFRKLAVVGPFVTFPYQAIRSAVNALTLSLHEIKSSNPVERMVGTKRLASQLGTISATYALEEAGRAYWGVSKQQEEDFRRFQPEWSHNSRFLFTGKDPQKGTMEAVNLSYTDPYAYITDPMIALIRGAASNEDPTEVAIEVAKEAARPWVSEQMLARAIIEARNGVTDSGREIYNPTDSSIEKGMKMVRHIMMTLEPGTLQRFQKRILPAIRNEQPLYGRKLEVGPEIFREATGLSIEKFSFKDGLAFRARAFTDTDRAAEKVFHQTLSRSQTTTPEDLVNAYKESDARRFQAWQEMRKDFLAAIRQGVTVDEARRVMVARGVSRKDAGLIALGRYEPMSISDQAQKRAKERDRKIPIEEIRKVREANRKPLD